MSGPSANALCLRYHHTKLLVQRSNNLLSNNLGLMQRAPLVTPDKRTMVSYVKSHEGNYTLADRGKVAKASEGSEATCINKSDTVSVCDNIE